MGGMFANLDDLAALEESGTIKPGFTKMVRGIVGRKTGEISNIVDLPIRKVTEILLKLELKKLIKTLPGEHFVKV